MTPHFYYGTLSTIKKSTTPLFKKYKKKTKLYIHTNTMRTGYITEIMAFINKAPI